MTDIMTDIEKLLNSATGDEVSSDQLYGWVRGKIDSAKLSISEITTKLTEALRQREGVYESQKLKEIRKIQQPEIFMKETAAKCRSATASLKDILLPSNGKPWDIKCTPLPDLPYEDEMKYIEYLQSGHGINQEDASDVMDIIKNLSQTYIKEKKIGDLKLKIDDELTEGGWYEALEDILPDIALMTGFIKGPIIKTKKVIKSGGVVEDRLTYCFERVSPFDIFPSIENTNIDDGFIIHRYYITLGELYNLKEQKGYKADAIDKILEESRESPKRDILFTQTEQVVLTALSPNVYPEKVEIFEFWGAVPGYLLQEWGLKGITDTYKHYEIVVFLSGHHIIKVAKNPHPTGAKPFSKLSYDEIPGLFWGNGIPEIIRDPQTAVNAISRSLLNNVAISSGPQVEIDTDRLQEGERPELYPWKYWLTTGKQMNGSKAINFYQPTLNVSELIRGYEFFMTLIDNQSGIIRYDSSGSGAMDTSSGYSMMIAQGSKIFKSVVKNIDRRIITRTIKLLYEYMLIFGDLTDDDMPDIIIIPQGASSLMTKELQVVRINEFLQVTNNPVDLQLIGNKARQNMLENVMDMFDISHDKLPDIDAMGMAQSAQGIEQSQVQGQNLLPDGQTMGGMNLQRNTEGQNA